ncbi:uncharacterized protein BDZ83DRAFT_784477 [Colletotrichum acutatum]|uniref:tyrosinase n=1 Tax=Glomerella acutata TaxID=27357 RepID=A0AAD8UIM9_GLOAC|nr:uncharacterized protein BDZ83DRAFT_784477 [Colletotrichum acutatum]KAK1721415.1 hypothetical protein BDZ83DRAFT_784477 [Colletotrichum acutatum]
MSKPRVRKDLATLNQDELDTLVRAFQHVISLKPDDKISYFTIAGYHGLPAPTAPGCSNLALPYWNEWSNESMEKRLPDLFTRKDYRFKDGSFVPNPLFFYKVRDSAIPLLWTGQCRLQHKDLGSQCRKLQRRRGKCGNCAKFKECLDAPNYTVFSNANSAQDWNKTRVRRGFHSVVVSLEEPHNSMHLAVEGFDVPSKLDDNVDVYPFANGDMGENDTAAFDPIFFFHRCSMDYMFWKCWISYLASKAQRGLDTPLEPFTKEKITPGDTRPMISNDVTNTADLGYGYPRLRGHFILPSPGFRKGPKLTASEINRARSRGSFVISTWAKGKNGQPDKLLDTKSDDEASDTDVYALVHTRDNPEGIDTIEGNKIQAELATTQQDIRAEARDQVVKTHTWLRKAQAVVGSIKY